MVKHEIYQNDTVLLCLNNELTANLNVSNGIRQGLSLFLLLTYLIILHLNETNIGLRDEISCIPALFFADNGLLLAQSEEEALNMITILTEAAQASGLEINKDKSFIMLYNHQRNHDDLNGIKKAAEIKYLWSYTNK